MNEKQAVDNAIDWFWNNEEELKQLDSGKIVGKLPLELLPPANFLRPFTLTPKQWIYRARPVDAGYMQGTGKIKISNYTYAPDEVTSLGRANLPKKPMFYGSENISATAFEARSNMEYESLIGCWRVKRGSPNANFSICACVFRPEINVDLKKILLEPLLSQVKFLDEIFSADRVRKVWTETRGGVQEKKESTKDDIHEITAPIADFLIRRENVDGILYHSAQAQGAKAVFPPYDESNWLFNIAINPSYVDKHMALEKVYQVKIETYLDDQGRQRAKRTATEIGVPVDEETLQFYELNDEQIREFEAVHNASGVPMLLPGTIELSIKNLPDVHGCQIVVDSVICAKHGTAAKLRQAVLDQCPGVVIEVCCVELNEPLQEALRGAGHWTD